VDRQAAMGWGSQCDGDFLAGATLELEAPRAVLARAASAFEAGKYGEAVSLWSNAQGWLNNLQAGESKRQLRAELDALRQANKVVFDREASMLRDPEMNRVMNQAAQLRGQLAELQRDRSASATLLRNRLNTELADVVARQLALQEAILRAERVTAAPP
jgi:ABC-type phosphate transport system auxiliary subunit